MQHLHPQSILHLNEMKFMRYELYIARMLSYFLLAKASSYSSFISTRQIHLTE